MSDQFCLGVGTYTVQIRNSASCGGGLITEINDSDIMSGTWSRLINATSSSQVVLPIRSNSMCCEFADLGEGIPKYEYWLWRDSPSKHHLVWSGILTDVNIGTDDTLTLEARDFSHDLSHKVCRDQNYSNTDIATIAARVAEHSFNLSNLYGLRTDFTPSDIIGKREIILGDGSRPLNVITDVLRQVVYWTQVRRDFRINLQGHCGWEFTDDDLNERPELSWSLDDYSTAVMGRASSSVYGFAGGTDTTRYGCPVLIERVLDVNAETNNQARKFAEVRLADMDSPGPSIDALQSSISPSCGVDLDFLWPGLKANILVDGYCNVVRRTLYVTQVEGAWNESNEEVRVELSPTIGDPNDPRVAAA